MHQQTTAVISLKHTTRAGASSTLLIGRFFHNRSNNYDSTYTRFFFVLSCSLTAIQQSTVGEITTSRQRHMTRRQLTCIDRQQMSSWKSCCYCWDGWKGGKVELLMVRIGVLKGTLEPYGNHKNQGTTMAWKFVSSEGFLSDHGESGLGCNLATSTLRHCLVTLSRAR